MKGTSNVAFISILLAVIVGGAIYGASRRPSSPSVTPTPAQTATATPTPSGNTNIIAFGGGDNAQKQQTFDLTTPSPTLTYPPRTNPNAPPLCQEGGANDEPEILVGYSPSTGQYLGLNGQIKVWVNDEGAPFIAPNERVDTTTGQITTVGDRSAKAPDGYLWEPALYISPQTAESGGTPHFPTMIKGDFNSSPPNKGSGTKGAPIDSPPAGTSQSETYTAEFIWDVNSLGLAPGNYQAEFVIHDGDDNRGVGCISIVIQ